MNYCEEYAALISAAIDDALTADERRKLMDHLAACPACREAYTQMMTMHEAFADWEEELPGDLTGDVMAKIRKEKALAKRRKRSWLPLVAAAACCALVFLGYQGLNAESNTVRNAAPVMDTKAVVSESADMAAAPANAAADDVSAVTKADDYITYTTADNFLTGEEDQLLEGVLTYFRGAPAEEEPMLEVEKNEQESEAAMSDKQTLLILTSAEEALVGWMAENTTAVGHTSEENATTAWLITDEECALLTDWLTAEEIAWEQYQVELPEPNGADVVCVVYLPA